MSRTVVFALVVCAFAIACGDDGRAERRADAINVAGSWLEVRDDGGPAAGLRLSLETDKNDLRAILSRDDDDDALAADEAALVARLREPNERLAVRSTLELGAGVDAVVDEVDGGENVSFDGGVTTTVRLITPPFAANDDDGQVQVTSLRWGLALDGDANELAGVVVVTSLEQRARADDRDGVFSAARRFEWPIRLRRN